MAVQLPVFHMERTGIRINLDERKRLKEQYQSEWDEAQMKLNGLAGGELNVNSPKQMKDFLYRDLKLPVRKSHGRVTADESALRALLGFSEDKMQNMKTKTGRMKYVRCALAIKQILRIRAKRKRLSSYLNIDIDDDGRMRTLLCVGGTETGRFSSSKTSWGTGCNLQTIPRELRTMFIPDDGFELAEFDLNRGESWIYSHISEDPLMMKIHLDGDDFHAITAAAISEAFGEHRSSKEIIEGYANDEAWAYKLRYLGKRFNHASSYRMGPFRATEVINGAADDTGITIVVSQAKRAQSLWKQIYFGMGGWWDWIERELNKTRSMTTPYGRKREFHDFWSTELFKQATASVPQSTSVDYLNCGMLGVYHNLVVPEVCGINLLHQNHDSILVQYPVERRNEAIPLIQQELTKYSVKIKGHRTGTVYDVKIPVEASFGLNWRELATWKG
jgi:DNA polymerase I-like protein with 3'-5' exonuclease and polymerase domains